jgi:hypothetical protein
MNSEELAGWRSSQKIPRDSISDEIHYDIRPIPSPAYSHHQCGADAHYDNGTQ